jgi:hypothetical protein
MSNEVFAVPEKSSNKKCSCGRYLPCTCTDVRRVKVLESIDDKLGQILRILTENK